MKVYELRHCLGDAPAALQWPPDGYEFEVCNGPRDYWSLSIDEANKKVVLTIHVKDETND